MKRIELLTGILHLAPIDPSHSRERGQLSAISNKTPCSDVEIDDLRAYISDTPVYQLAPMIQPGCAYKGAVIGVAGVGALTTIWTNLGTVTNRERFGTEKFIVKDAYTILLIEQTPDEKTTSTIQHYLQLLVKDSLDLNITLIGMMDNIFICDGNKRTVACYAHALANSIEDFSLPVYHIEVS